MKKAVIVAATAALLAGSALAQAASSTPVTVAQAAQPAAPAATPQAAPSTATPMAPAGEQATRTDRMSRRFEANLGELKDGLKLTADQEKLWPAFETTLKEVAQRRWTAMAERRAQRQAAAKMGVRPAQPDPVTRLRNAAGRMTASAADLTKVADALGPLYQTLNADQQKTFDALVRKDLRSFFAMPHPPRREHPRRG